MTKAKTAWLLLGILCLASLAMAQDTGWAKYMDAAKAAFDRGQYAEAEKQFKAALKEAEKFGEEDPRLGISLSRLGNVYRAEKRYAEAEPLYRRALAILEKALAPEHPFVATPLNNLAELYRTQGRYAEAEPLYKRALAIREKALGPKHPHVAQSLENYAKLLRKTNRKPEAAKIEARAQAIRTKHAETNPTK